jgi:hypothetical protein
MLLDPLVEFDLSDGDSSIDGRGQAAAQLEPC